MLKTLIKRSGEREDFQSAKTNGWMIRMGHGLTDRMNWSSIVLEARQTAPEEMYSQDWQMHLINLLKVRGSQKDGWPYMLMAGRLYTIYQMKKLHGDKYPKLKKLTRFLINKNVARDMGYTDEELDFLDEHVIDHERNLEMAWTQVEQYNLRYSLRDFVTKETYETPQFTNMRMAMAVYEKQPPIARLDKVAKLYRALCDDILNPPSPNYSALGTRHFGMASCCLIQADDDAESILAAGNVAYMMTLASGGIGMLPTIRAPGDPVDGGRVMHSGRLNYVRKFVGDVSANKQGPRGGAVTMYDIVYSPELDLSIMMQNPRTPVELRERRLNVAYMTNPLFMRKAAKKEQFFTFTKFSAPDLFEAFFKGDQTEFEELYAKYEADPTFEKNYRDAFKTQAWIYGQRIEQSTLFWANPSEFNRHTSFKDTCYQSNLCMEVIVPTMPWRDVKSLYDPEGNPENGETGICNIGSVPIHRLPFNPSSPLLGYERYKEAVRAMMEIIDYAIDNSEYHFPAIATQAKSRRNCSVGMSGVATLFAKLGLKHDTPEGLRVWHVLCERHMFACIEVALELGIERGNAPWMHRTKWPDGWMPIDTYKKTIDNYVDSTLHFAWEHLRSRVVANGGIRFSSLVAHMPGEQATRKGNGSNSIYLVQQTSVDLSDGTSAMPWAALDNDLPEMVYQTAWEVSHLNHCIRYGIAQKFGDQGISADTYEDRTTGAAIKDKRLVQQASDEHRLGLKTGYYVRSLTPQGGAQEDLVIKPEAQPELQPAVTPEADDVFARIARQAALLQAEAGETVSCTLDGNCGA